MKYLTISESEMDYENFEAFIKNQTAWNGHEVLVVVQITDELANQIIGVEKLVEAIKKP